ncbi:non-oxidative hydroxyarylic acid decarboxylases subunit D [Vibrio olivae]|uniref:Non-oxidative hydroxyarylic acid decarboxylases subunit D n=1 Tax=Vibrio olivae TaxID=1243002 RepID=A0ABV5HR69_9VIBR
MICPRCEHHDIELLATSPVPDVWKVHQCQRCLYTWRSTEPLRRISREHYPEEFRMTQQDIDNAPEVPSVPPLLSPSER